MSKRFEDDDAPRGDDERMGDAASDEDLNGAAQEAEADMGDDDAAVDEVVDAQEAAPAKKKRNPLPFIAAGAVVALGVLGGVGFMLMRGGAPAPVETVALAPMGEPARKADSGVIAPTDTNPPPAGMLSSTPGEPASGAPAIQPGQPMVQAPASAMSPAGPVNPGTMPMASATGAAPIPAAVTPPTAAPATLPPPATAPMAAVQPAQPAQAAMPATATATAPTTAPAAGGLAPMGVPAKPVATKPAAQPAPAMQAAEPPQTAAKQHQERKRVVAQSPAPRKSTPSNATPRKPAGGADKEAQPTSESQAMAAVSEVDSPLLARLNLRAVYPSQGPDMQAWVMDGDTMTVVSRGSLIAGAKVLEVRPGAVVTDRGTIR